MRLCHFVDCKIAGDPGAFRGEAPVDLQVLSHACPFVLEMHAEKLDSVLVVSAAYSLVSTRGLWWQHFTVPSAHRSGFVGLYSWKHCLTVVLLNHLICWWQRRRIRPWLTMRWNVVSRSLTALYCSWGSQIAWRNWWRLADLCSSKC